MRFSKNPQIRSQAPQELPVQRITFLCEQDGKIEKELKLNLLGYFKSNIHVMLACLARVRYGDAPTEKVALCLRADHVDRSALVEHVSTDFQRMFKTTESLDIIFLSAEQENKLLLVAKPFYKQHAHQT